MKPARQDRIALFCWANVASTFAMMQNPKYRGPNFSWDSFPEMASSHVAMTVAAMVDAKSTERGFIEQTCHDIAAQLVKRSQE